MSAQPLRVIDAPTVLRRRSLAPAEAGTTSRTDARRHVTDVLCLVALSLDANASSGAARAAKYATLRGLVAEVAGSATTASSSEVAAALHGLEIEAGLTLSADRVVGLVRDALTPEDVAHILRAVVTARWADGTRLQSDPAVALAYASRLLTPSASDRQIEQVRRPGFVRRVFPRRTPSTTAARSLRVAAPLEPTWREPSAPRVEGVEGVLYLPLFARATAQRAAGTRSLSAVAGDDFSAA